MTNKDKFLRDGVSEEEFIEAYCISGRSAVNGRQVYLLKDFFNEQVKPIKPTLTEDERVILRNMENATHIKRDNGIKYIDKDEYVKTYYELPYTHLFQFIKERRRI